MLCSFLEKNFGYNRYVEHINAVVTAIANPIFFVKYLFRILRAKLTGKSIAVFTFSLPQHRQNLDDIPNLLKEYGYEVFIFAEWDTKSFPNYKIDDALPVFYDVWRLLPLTFADVAITPTAVKSIYYPAGATTVCTFHSLAGVEAFPSDSFLPFDVVLCAGQHHIDDLKIHFSSARKTAQLIPCGYPKLDMLAREFSDANKQPPTNDVPTVIYCPGLYEPELWSSIKDHGAAIVSELITEFNVILRPHPYNLKRGDIQGVLDSIITTHSNNPRFTFDTSTSYVETYKKSDLMLSDVSGTAFTYFLASGKPVVFFDPNFDKSQSEQDSRTSIGDVIESLDDLLTGVKKQLDSKELVQKRLENARNTIVFHFGLSSKASAAAIDCIARNQAVDGSVTAG